MGINDLEALHDLSEHPDEHPAQGLDGAFQVRETAVELRIRLFEARGDAEPRLRQAWEQ
jgi:hypothetical protein